MSCKIVDGSRAISAAMDASGPSHSLLLQRNAGIVRNSNWSAFQCDEFNAGNWTHIISQHGSMTETIARRHIALADTDPLILRRGDMHVEGSPKMLYDVIQGAMGWLDYLWEFELESRQYGIPDPEWPDDSLFAAKNTKPFLRPSAIPAS